MNLQKHIVFLGTDNLDEAEKFYHNIIGLQLISKNQDSLVFKLDEEILRISLIKDFTPQQFTVLGWIVEDIAQSVVTLGTKGVEFINYPQFDQDEDNIWTMDNVKLAWFEDPSGNNLSLTEQG